MAAEFVKILPLNWLIYHQVTTLYLVWIFSLILGLLCLVSRHIGQTMSLHHPPLWKTPKRLHPSIQSGQIRIEHRPPLWMKLWRKLSLPWSEIALSHQVSLALILPPCITLILATSSLYFVGNIPSLGPFIQLSSVRLTLGSVKESLHMHQAVPPGICLFYACQRRMHRVFSHMRSPASVWTQLRSTHTFQSTPTCSQRSQRSLTDFRVLPLCPPLTSSKVTRNFLSIQVTRSN